MYCSKEHQSRIEVNIVSPIDEYFIVKETERVKAWARSSKLLRLTGVFSQTADVLRSSCETEAGVARPDMRSNSESMVARGQSLSVSGSPESEPPLYVMN